MLRRRNNLDIMAEVLEIAQLGAKKTWIVYKANLNFKIVKDYLDELMEKGLLEYDGSIYSTTDRGFEFLEEYRNFRKFRRVVAA
ncbi:MAG: winged helix-turn-helix domain-containing protein [Candidatus Bathyarchaeia archaeon]